MRTQLCFTITQKKRALTVLFYHSKDNIELMSKVKIGNTNARVGISIVDFESKTHIETVESISELCKKFNLTRGQVEHYIYKQRPCNGLLFVRQKIIKRK